MKEIDKFNDRFISITYIIYIIFWEIFVIGGSAYVVFELGHSEWWILLGVILSAGAYPPKKWRQLFK